MPTYISQLTALLASETATGDKMPILDVSARVIKAITIAELRKIVTGLSGLYVASLVQAGSAAPTPTVIKNFLSDVIVWTRTSAGLYVGTLSGAFTADKVNVIAHGRATSSGMPIVMDGYRLTDNTIALRTFDEDDWTATVRVEVYS